MGGIIIGRKMDKEICVFCHNNEATKLCDFPTGVITLSIDFIPTRTTCSLPMCDDCATYIDIDTDFCPRCMEDYKNKFINWKKSLNIK